jgi:hypothetical protein
MVLTILSPSCRCVSRRYLKRIFRDLFERQSFEDDGVFDWDIIKRQQLAAGGDGAIETNPDGTVKPAVGAGVMGGAGEGAPMNDAAYTQNATNANAVSGGSRAQESGKAEGGATGPDGSRLDDSAGDRGDAGQRRSIISSIR